ncbi:VOC family protein [Bradyrhizobium sp. LLZ17]|uniref:VOC family protein n=1 Tax=Bradyrhizobium sp. LLZ17 TaxID=3239388 RepID=A0AB39XIV2_9BRAD
MLANAKVATRLPAKDLDRARAFYSEKLGLEPVEHARVGSATSVPLASLRSSSRPERNPGRTRRWVGKSRTSRPPCASFAYEGSRSRNMTSPA